MAKTQTRGRCQFNRMPAASGKGGEQRPRRLFGRILDAAGAQNHLTQEYPHEDAAF